MPPKSDAASTLPEILSALDLEAPGLKAADAAWADGDAEGAARQLASYFRARTNVRWSRRAAKGWIGGRSALDELADPSGITFDRAEAGAIARGDLKVDGLRYAFPDGEIDWLFNAVPASPGRKPNYEWQSQLNRMDFWDELGDAYLVSKDERYAEAWVQQLRSWIRQSGVAPSSAPSRDDTEPDSWRTINAGSRMRLSWPHAFHRFLRSSSFLDADLLAMIRAFLEHGRYLRHFSSIGRNNWLAIEMQGLYTVGGLFPEFHESGDWRSFAIATAHGEFQRQFLPDGAQFELTPGYHETTTRNLTAISTLAHSFAREDELPDGYLAHAEGAAQYLFSLLAPDRTAPEFNDTWEIDVPNSLRRAAQLFPRRRDFAWIGSGGEEGERPSALSVAFPYAGYFVMRTSWERDAHYCCFDGGRTGFAHIHQDKLNMVLWCHGRELLFDNGGGRYENTRWRDYATAAFSHNTGIVDGLSQFRRKSRDLDQLHRPVDVLWRTDGARDSVTATYDEGYGEEEHRPATHTRQVLFVKPGIFLVADSFRSRDGRPHEYQLRWHLKTTRWRQDDVGVQTADPGMPNLLVLPLSQRDLGVRAVSAQEEPEILGWDFRHSELPAREPALTVLHDKQGAADTVFLTLLLPLPAGADTPVVSVSEEEGRTVLHLRDGTTWQVDASAPGAAPSLRFEERAPDGNVLRQATT
jgi:hypothetical protein